MKNAFVSGANRGLGKGFVDYLSGAGYHVFAGTRKLAPDVKDSENVTWVEIDVTSDKSISKAFGDVRKGTALLDLLINNAGVSKDTATNNHKELVCSLKDLDRSLMLKMFDVNSVSPMMILKQFIPLLNGKPSFVINITSGRGSYQDEYPNPIGNYGYRASKTALNMLTHCSTWDLPENVKTFAVHPGGVKTDMNPRGEHDPKIQAEMIVAITKNWKDEFNGRFLRYNGVLYPL